VGSSQGYGAARRRVTMGKAGRNPRPQVERVRCRVTVRSVCWVRPCTMSESPSGESRPRARAPAWRRHGQPAPVLARPRSPRARRTGRGARRAPWRAGLTLAVGLQPLVDPAPECSALGTSWGTPATRNTAWRRASGRDGQARTSAMRFAPACSRTLTASSSPASGPPSDTRRPAQPRSWVGLTGPDSASDCATNRTMPRRRAAGSASSGPPGP
jgi:hypothetical protein